MKKRASQLVLSKAEFDEVVEKALAKLPDRFSDLLENVAVVVAERAGAGLLERLEIGEEADELFGLYEGVSLADRSPSYYGGVLPDRIWIFRQPILRACRNRAEAVREIRDTVIHELGHYFGLDDDEMDY